MFNLRGVYIAGGSSGGVSSLSFAQFASRVVGNLGAPLGLGDAEDSDEMLAPVVCMDPFVVGLTEDIRQR